MQTVTQWFVPLSHLVSTRRNLRRVEPAREAHHQLVALIRSQRLLQPLVVRPMEDKPKHYLIIACHRRLAASFLRCLGQRDGCDPLLCDCIHAPRLYRLERYPQGPTWT